MKIKLLRQANGIQQKELATFLGIPANTLSQYELGKREMPYQTLSAIADYFHVSIDYICGRENLVRCPKCGLLYIPDSKEDVANHNIVHRNWEKASLRYGKIYLSSENEQIKAQNRNIVNSQKSTLQEKYQAELEVMRCLFSRSLEASGFNESHIDYRTYVAMLLNQPSTQANMSKDLYDKMVNEFGISDGIPVGTYYSISALIPNKPDKEKSLIFKYRSLDDHGRKAVDFILESELIRVEQINNLKD